MDEACPLLRALHAVLPRGRVTQPTRTSRNGEAFARRYGQKVGPLLRGAISGDGVLQREAAVQVLTKWRVESAEPVKGMGNHLPWLGFRVSPGEARAFCEQALDDPHLVRGGPA